jgi:peptide/nickel transport system permease protein
MPVVKSTLTWSAAVGLIVVLANLLLAAGAPFFAHYGESALVGNAWAPPSAEHWFGLDNLGRDMFARLAYGGRTTISLALVVALLSFSIGVSLGFVASIRGGWIDAVLGWIVDVLMAIPNLIFVLIVLSVMGTSVPVLICTIAAYDWTRVFRLSRNISLEIMAMDFVEAARLRGEGMLWIMRRELLPNTLRPLVAEFGLRFSFSFLFIASLSFLGLGIQPPHADWGSMVRENASAIGLGLPAPLIPAAAIALLTIGVNLSADWLLSLSNRGTLDVK